MQSFAVEPRCLGEFAARRLIVLNRADVGLLSFNANQPSSLILRVAIYVVKAESGEYN